MIMDKYWRIKNYLIHLENDTLDVNMRYVIMRYIQILCIGAFVFGALWEGTIKFNLTTPQFLMVYGGTGAVITEFLARLFKKYEKKHNSKK